MSSFTDLPPEEIESPTPESRLEAFAEMLKEARKGVEWTPMLDEILDSFEKFLVDRPEPPASWSKRVGADASRYDYYQIVLPPDIIDPYKDDLENVRLLREKSAGEKGSMALEQFLVTHNHFLYGNGHAASVFVPRPLVMLESFPESKEVDWDCFLTVFPDGSWQSYNLERDDEENIGEDISENMERWSHLIHHMRVIVPAEGRDWGWFKEVEIEDEEKG
jgi:hypothetical protein